VLDEEGESDVISEESDDFSLSKGVEVVPCCQVCGSSTMLSSLITQV
jgi:hypothetical protein